jgi:spore coat protein CotH
MSLKFKRNSPIILLLVAVITILALVMGNLPVIPYITKADATGVEKHTEAKDITNKVALFDDSVAHSVQVIMSDKDYAEMISNYKSNGSKEYFKADVSIDGVRITNVGIRLKGNASLRTALGGGMGGGGGNRANNGNMPGNGQQPGGQPNANGGQRQPPGGNNGQAPQQPANGEMPQMPGFANSQENAATPVAGATPAAPQAAQSGGPGMGAQPTSGKTKIPFLIKFNEFEEGQTYQGYSAIAIRTYGTSFDAAILQEPVTNDTARLTGLPATRTSYTGFKINDATEELYVISEIIDKEYLAKYFDYSNGLLYKAELGSTLEYRGEELDSYNQSFSQETHTKTIDMAPLIAFTRFLSQSDDATFESDLPKYLDVDSLATYLAVNNLVVNTDSLVGMNNNYYLYYDDVKERFTLMMWDANESLGKLGGSVTYDLYFSNSGGGPGGNRGVANNNNNVVATSVPSATKTPVATQAASSAQNGDDRVGIAGGPGNGMGGPGGGGMPGRGQNVLVTRFMANATFKALYEQKVKEIYEKAFASGAMTADVERYSALIHSVNDARGLVDITAYDQAVQKALSFIEQRMKYLETTELLSK